MIQERTIFIFVKWNGTEWKNYIHFRDYLNDNENMALQYQKVKGRTGK